MLRQFARLRAAAAPVPALRSLATSAAAASSSPSSPAAAAAAAAADAVLAQRAAATTSASAAPRPSAAAAASSPPLLLPFTVGRTPSSNLPVYQEARSGKTNKFTLIRRVEGDRNALRLALVRELAFPPAEVKVKPVTGHVSVKGWHAPRITEWLKAKGF